MDGLIPKDSLQKSTSDAAKVAAGAVMTSDFLKRTNLALAKRGHQCIMMAQVRAEIRADKYTPKDRNQLGGASGGNAAVHMPDWVCEFQRPKNDDMILADKDKNLSSTNPPIGRYASVKICKSINDTTLISFSYPIKFKRTNGESIWVEMELIDILLQWSFFKRSGSWYSSDELLTKYLGKELKAQGIHKLYALVENDKDLMEKLKKFAYLNIPTLQK